MKKVLILEDQGEIFSNIKIAFDKYSDHFDIYPKLKNSIDRSYNNWGHLMDSIRRKKFSDVMEFEPFQNIDLFIIDLTLLNLKSNDRIGVEFLNFLGKENYCESEFEYIICTRHDKELIGELTLEFNPDKNYIYKPVSNKKQFPDKVATQALKLFGITDSKYELRHKRNVRFWETETWNDLPTEIERHILNRLILVVLYLLIFSTSIYAIMGVMVQTIELINQLLQNKPKPTDLLKYVEDIYLFVLPLFIIFSFVSYYKSTIGVRLIGGDTRDIDHDGAMKSLSNSKFILISSLASFTIIKIIDIIFTIPLPNLLALCSYGIFLLILMSYIILQHRLQK